MKNSKKNNKRQLLLVLPAILGALIWAITPFVSSSAAGSFTLTSPVSDTEIEASLTGSPINGQTPFGRARYRVESNNRRRFDVEVFQVGLPGGTVLNVQLNNTTIGQLIVSAFSSGQFSLRTDNGQTVPIVNNGDTVRLLNAGNTVLNGTFGVTAPSPSPTGSPNGTPTGTPTGTPSPSPTGSPTESPSPSPTGTPTGSPSPSPTASPSPDGLFAQLSGATINGAVPRGFGEYSLHQSGTNRRIRAFVSSINLPAGTVLSVVVNDLNIGQFILQSGGFGEFRIESRDNPIVPVVTAGSTMKINNGGTTILSGTFSGGVSPSPTPTGSPSPSPTGTPTGTPSPSPTATPSARFFDAELRGSQVVPAVNSDARGSARILLNSAGNEIQVVMSFFGLSSNQTAATINGVALPGANAPVIFNIGTIGGTSGFFPTRTFAVTPEQVAQLRSGLWYVTISSQNNPAGEIRGQIRAEHRRMDFEGDGLSDLAVFRPSNGGWYFLNSSDGAFRAQSLGGANDKVVSGDYDGDGVGDIAVFRDLNGYGVWQVRRSSDDQVSGEQWGLSTDKPIAADFDGDGRNDLAVFRPSNGGWYIRRSSDNSLLAMHWGTDGDVPLAADYDGDGRADITVFRPSTGAWYIHQSSDNRMFAMHWGMNGDIPQTGDFDNDGESDVAVFRPSNGAWYIRLSLDGSLKAELFGQSGDTPVAGNFDFDLITDIAVFRPSNGAWYIKRSSDDGFASRQFGQNGDLPAAQ